MSSCSKIPKYRDLYRFKKPEIDQVFNKAIRKTNFSNMRFITAKNKNSYGKFLAMIPKKVGKAHFRNLLRRRIQSLFFDKKFYLLPFDSVLLIRPALLETFSYKNILEVFNKYFDRIKDL